MTEFTVFTVFTVQVFRFNNDFNLCCWMLELFALFFRLARS